ncbi:MAG: flippase [Lachnospiraceae bacterium]
MGEFMKLRSRNSAMGSLSVNALFNILKQCCNIVFPLITYPFVARVLGAENLGKYSFSDSVVGYFMLFASLGISTYAVREGARIRNEKKEMEIFSAELFSINLIAMVLSCFVLFFLLFVKVFDGYTLLMYILSINIVTSVIGRDWLNSIYEDFSYLSIRYIFFQFAALILLFLFLRKPDDYIKYTAIMTFANSGGYFASFFYTQKYVPIRITGKLNIKRHLKPILYLFCSSLAVTVYIRSDITILGLFRSDAEVGIYTLASKVYTIIKALLNAVIMVVIPRLSNYLGEGRTSEYHGLLNKLQDAIGVFIFPCVTGLFFLSEDVMLMIGGSAYRSGYISLKILCMALIFAVFGCFYSQAILVVEKKEKYFLFATVLSAVINILFNIIAVPVAGMTGAAITTVIAEMAVMIICRFYSKQNTNWNDRKSSVSVLAGCMFIMVICLFSKTIFESMLIRLSVSIGISGAVYFFSLIIMKNRLVLEVLKYYALVFRGRE